ncbi:MAG: hypothetical protein ACRC57_05315 [Sarcina sp.]
MKQSKFYYKKGLKYFNKGELEKAIASLDIAISHDMKNSKALNLRGVIYNIKGQDQKALTSWNININFNNDEIARKYIEHYELDKINILRYEKALKYINKLEIKQAIKILEDATASEYNILNVRNALSYCYINQFNFELAKKNSEIVLQKDCNNKEAKKNILKIKKESKVSNRSIKTYSIAISLGLLVFSGIIFFTICNPSEGKNKIIKEEIKKENEIIEREETEKNDIDEILSDTENNNDSKVSPNFSFTVNEMSEFLEDENYKAVDKILKSFNLIELSQEEEEIVNNSYNVMKSKGVEFFYQNGRNEFKKNNFVDAKDLFIKALEYSQGNYLDKHIIYFTAVCFDMLEQENKAIEYYEKYAIEYNQDKSYMEEVLYKLSILNMDKDKEKSKKYASILSKNYIDSIYNNEIIKNILKR